MLHSDPAAAAPAISDMLAQSQRILLLTHVNPDGDAIGSMLGVWHALQGMGKTAFPLASSSLPTFVDTLPGIEHVEVYTPGTALPEVDVIWMVDTADIARVGAIHDDHAATLSSSPLIIVDHHATNVGQGKVNLVDPAAASCAELVYALLRALDAPVSPEAATCLLMGLSTDTQSFQTSSTHAHTLRIAAELLDAGADQYGVVQKVYFAYPYSTTHLVGLSLSQMQREGSLIWSHISLEMARQTGASDDAYDSVVGMMQRIEGGQLFVLFKERTPDTIKISLRSKPNIDVSEIARLWGGGGHRQAAGATLHMSLEAAQQEVLPVLRQHLATSG